MLSPLLFNQEVARSLDFCGERLFPPWCHVCSAPLVWKLNFLIPSNICRQIRSFSPGQNPKGNLGIKSKSTHKKDLHVVLCACWCFSRSMKRAQEVFCRKIAQKPHCYWMTMHLPEQKQERKLEYGQKVIKCMKKSSAERGPLWFPISNTFYLRIFEGQILYGLFNISNGLCLQDFRLPLDGEKSFKETNTFEGKLT